MTITTIPAVDAFDDESEDSSNNFGMCGEFSMVTTDGAFKLSATLASNNPDSSRDSLRAKHTLNITLENLKDASCIKVPPKQYEYYGDTPGEHLANDMREGLLLDYCQQELDKQAKKVKKPAKGARMH